MSTRHSHSDAASKHTENKQLNKYSLYNNNNNNNNKTTTTTNQSLCNTPAPYANSTIHWGLEVIAEFESQIHQTAIVIVIITRQQQVVGNKQFAVISEQTKEKLQRQHLDINVRQDKETFDMWHKNLYFTVTQTTHPHEGEATKECY
ncbi:unnamed protein product [Ceratitis capitata]|uniref:(Mediterranean fruit fly) hypothetical protein n=1 Tax=Ceratitis capitata TaxID=7213 RepID=A0A811V840_CERCA|nr:unnamed protein product [Ceratitis capitata]